MSFFKGLLDALIVGAAQSVANSGGGGFKAAGTNAGAGAIAGAVVFVLQHPIGQHPAIQAAVFKPQA